MSIFDDDKIRIEMFSLRKRGRTFKSLAKRYECTERLVKDACYEFDIEPNGVPRIKEMSADILANEFITSDKYKEIIYEKVNSGRSYRDYLKIEKKKKKEREEKANPPKMGGVTS